MKNLFATLTLSLMFSACASRPPALEEGFVGARLGLGGGSTERYAILTTGHSGAGPDESGIRVDNLTARATSGRYMHLERYAGITSIESETMLRERLNQLEAIYKQPLVREHCAAEFQPALKTLELDGRVMHTVALYANDRLAFGACAKDQAAYRADVALIHCTRAARAYIVVNYVPASQYNETDTKAIEALECL